jgi:hypothetical protein
MFTKEKRVIKELAELAVPKIKNIEELYQNADKELAIIDAERKLKEEAFYAEYGEICSN